jgi:NAD(P)-dependent dehydrogenase (short-subunit alcohol dehydrogenase family)
MPTVLVTGAGRGLGLEFARQYAAAGWQVIGTVRKPEAGRPLAELGRNVEVHLLDVVDRPAIAKLAKSLAGRSIDLLIANAGVIGSRAAAVAEADVATWHQTFDVNVVAPVMLAQEFAPHVAASTDKRIAFISSRQGSIESTNGGSMIYRTTKAALNMAAKNLAIALREQGITVLIFHPGWVKTDMGGPGAAIGPEESIRGMRQVVAGATPEQSGRFFNYDGATIPW